MVKCEWENHNGKVCNHVFSEEENMFRIDDMIVCQSHWEEAHRIGDE